MNLKGLLTALIMLLLIFVIFILKQGGLFKSIKPHFDGSIDIVETQPGIEDITTDLESGIAYLSSHNRRARESTGSILLRKPGDKIKPMLITEMGVPLKPHGLAILKTEKTDYLFIVNHEEANLTSILRFEIHNDSLIHMKRFTHELFVSPNDIEAVSSDEFYITNDHTTAKGFQRKIKDLTLSKDGNVVFYKKGQAAVVSKPMAYPNGIRLSKNKEYLYVAATTENKLYVLNHTNDLKKRQILDSKELSTSPDNIEIDKFGYLWIACHPKLLKFLAHGKDASKKSPSQFLKIVYLPNTNYKFLQEEVFLSDGSDISGSSVASYFHSDSTNTMLVGSVYEDKILVLERAL